MSQPVRFREANLILGPPEGSEDAVVPMPVRRLEGNLVSCWRMSPAELAEIQRTGCVWLSVWGRETQPPVYVAAFKQEVI
jgi:hypothetical protein